MKTFKELQGLVIKWGEDRDLYHPEHGATESSQILKFIEETGELAQGLLKNDRALIKDSIGDCQVVLINLAKMQDFDLSYFYDKENVKYIRDFFTIGIHKGFTESDIMLNVFDSLNNESIFHVIAFLEAFSSKLGFGEFECLNSAYEEIKDRKGKMMNRAFVKNN